jgi:phage/plasmid-like protein (TIGR03299 family)
MAHEVENMFYVGAAPWHNLGRRFEVPPSLEEALVAAGLDWTVSTEPLFSGAKEQVEAMLTRRSSDNSILGVVGPNYVPLQNTEAFDFFKPFIDEKAAAIETAGSLRQGKRVWVLAKINRDPMIIKGNDVVEKYVLLSNSHDGTLAVRVGFTPVRVVCNNTLSMAINSNASKLIRIKHTKNVAANLESVQEIMNLADAEFETTAEQYRLLTMRDINTKDLEKYVKIVFNTTQKLAEVSGNLDSLSNKKILESVIPLFEKGRGNDMKEIKGTYWAAYNAVNEYLQYERGSDNQNRMDNMWFGDSARLNKKALETALILSAA